MAKVIGPLHSTEARGSVGGLTYNTWRGIRTVKERAGPPGPATGPRLAALLLGKAASFDWADLNDAQRAAWNNYGNTHLETDWTGQDQRLSGHSWYVRIHVRRALIGLPAPTAPPSEELAEDALPVAFYNDGPDLICEWITTPLDPPQEGFLELYLATATSPGRTLTIHDAARFTTAPLADYTISWTPTTPGKFTLFTRVFILSGLVGPWHQISTYLPP